MAINMRSLDDIAFNHDTVGTGSIFPDDRRRISDVDIYVRDGTYMGIKVDSRYTNRMIPKDADMSEIFSPVYNEQVYCFNIFPGSEDIDKYRDVLQSIADGYAILESQDKHPTDKGFVILLVVNYARMVFRKDELNEDYPKIQVTNE